MKRELDFSEGNVREGWFGVKGFWKEMEDQTKRMVRIGAGVGGGAGQADWL